MELPCVLFLGHSQVQTTARYAHLADAPVKAAADRIAGRVAEVADRSSPPAFSPRGVNEQGAASLSVPGLRSADAAQKLLAGGAVHDEVPHLVEHGRVAYARKPCAEPPPGGVAEPP